MLAMDTDDQTPIIVYRIECPIGGRGPFWTDRSLNGEHIDRLKDMRAPCHDPGIGYRFRPGIDYFAFPSLEILKYWVGEHWDSFRCDGFVLCVYLTDEYMVGKQQVAFVKDAATLLATFHEIPEEEYAI